MFFPPLQSYPLDSIDAQPIAAYGVRYLTQRYGRGPFATVVRHIDGAIRDIYGTSAGTLDIEAALRFAGGGTAEVLRKYDLTGNGRHANFVARSGPLLVRNGVVNIVADLPVYCSSGNSFGKATMPFSWDQPLVINGVFIQASAPMSKAYAIGLDTTISTYRDIQMTVGADFALGLGEDLNSMTPNTAKLAKDTAHILSLIRNATGTTTRGYIKQNGLLVSTMTTESQSTSITPSQLALYADPDNSASRVPLGSGWQEIVVFNTTTPPSASALLTLEFDQGAFFNIPLFGTLAWPIQVSRKILASNGSALTSNTGANITYR